MKIRFRPFAGVARTYYIITPLGVAGVVKWSADGWRATALAPVRKPDRSRARVRLTGRTPATTYRTREAASLRLVTGTVAALASRPGRDKS